MKILHTSDWHIGKLVHGIHMTEDQAYILEKMLLSIEREKPDLILIAGDLYDRSVPPIEAVTLVNDCINQMIKLGCKVVIIPGNHDSAKRIGFCKDLLRKSELYIADSFEEALVPLEIWCKDHLLHLYLVPFLEPAIVNHYVEDKEILTHDDVFSYLSSKWRDEASSSAFKVLVAHGFFGKDSMTSESERPLAVGGSEIISHEHLKEFDYVALGHLHRAQKVAEDWIRYSGSLLKYSFSEVDQEKSITWIEKEDHLKIRTEKLPLLRDMRKIEGKLEDLLKNPQGNKEDYLLVVLTDPGDLFEPLKQLRSIYPNLLKLIHQRESNVTSDGSLTREMVENKSMKGLFKAFYQDMFEDPLTSEEETFLNETVSQVIKGEN